MALVSASSCSSDSTPGLGNSTCRECGPTKKKKERKEVESEREQNLPRLNICLWPIHYFKLIIFSETADKGENSEDKVEVTLW